jgi:hypothetical protein
LESIWPSLKLWLKMICAALVLVAMGSNEGTQDVRASL